jgi:hypothetical protein
MSSRLLPRQNVDPHDVVDYFALSTTDAGLSDPDTDGDNAAGVFVKISSANMNADPVTFTASTYMGKQHSSPVGRNYYPTATAKIVPATNDAGVLGITLQQTLTHDENGEKLLYYSVKAKELNCAVSGQAVKVATKGEFDITANAVDGSLSVGSGYKVSANAGKITGCAWNDGDALGLVMGTGSRAAGDKFAGNTYRIKLG